MQELEKSVTDEKIVSYRRALTRALQLKQDIMKDIQEGKNSTYITIEDRLGSHGVHLEIGDDLLKIAQGAVFGAYRALVYDKIFIKETKEEIRVINPAGKAIADGIIRDMRMEPSLRKQLEPYF